MTFGLYYSGRSPIHALPAGLKLAGLAIAGIGLFFVHSLVGLLVFLGLVVLVVAIARLPWRLVWDQVRPLVWVLGAIFVGHALLTTWQTGAVLVLRFAALVLLATVTTLTTRTMDLVDALARALEPLRRLGVKPERLSLLVAIAIRFIPVILEQIREIQDAQRARGVERPLVTLLVPLLIRTLKIADDLSDALEARCFDAED